MQHLPEVGPTPLGFDEAAGRVLRHLRESTGLHTWAVGRLQEDEWVVLASYGGALDGVRFPWERTLCSALQRRGDEGTVPDLDADPELAAVRDGLGLALGSFVTVPVRGEGGALLGTLCGGGTKTTPEELARHRRDVELMGEVLGSLLAADLRLERESRSREVAESDAQTDALTGLGNRRFWDAQLLAEEERCRRFGSSAAVLTVDVDGLKAVNDDLGHLAGDAALATVARALRSCSRPGDVLVRWGGDEFLLLLPGADAVSALDVAERLTRAVADAELPAPWADRPLSVSVGVCGDSAQRLPMEALDAALNVAKRDGKGRAQLASGVGGPT